MFTYFEIYKKIIMNIYITKTRQVTICYPLSAVFWKLYKFSSITYY